LRSDGPFRLEQKALGADLLNLGTCARKRRSLRHFSVSKLVQKSDTQIGVVLVKLRALNHQRCSDTDAGGNSGVIFITNFMVTILALLGSLLGTIFGPTL